MPYDMLGGSESERALRCSPRHFSAAHYHTNSVKTTSAPPPPKMEPIDALDKVADPYLSDEDTNDPSNMELAKVVSGINFYQDCM